MNRIEILVELFKIDALHGDSPSLEQNLLNIAIDIDIDIWMVDEVPRQCKYALIKMLYEEWDKGRQLQVSLTRGARWEGTAEDHRSPSQ